MHPTSVGISVENSDLLPLKCDHFEHNTLDSLKEFSLDYGTLWKKEPGQKKYVFPLL